MSKTLLTIYEITFKASQVKTKKAFKEFERWVISTIATCQDAAVERMARIQLYKLRDQFAMV
jgi:hypothetical protein